MPWVTPRTGTFSNWPAAKTAKVATDPYLLWAEATGFVHNSVHEREHLTRVTRAATTPAEVPVLIELGEGWSAKDLRTKGSPLIRIPAIYDDLVGTDDAPEKFVTARILPGFMAEVTSGELKGATQRVELGMPNRPERALIERSDSLPQSTTRTLLGVIDTGCPFAHASLRRGSAGKTRVLSIWDQESSLDKMAFNGAIAGEPRAMGYGMHILRDRLETIMSAATTDGILNEDACYEAANYRLLRPAITHGAHILDLLAGPVALGHRVWTRVPGEAPAQPDFTRTTGTDAVDADIAFVQFPRDALGDTTGGWLCVHVLDAVRYILACKGPQTERVVISLSYGSQVGPHDGTSTLERALADLCERYPCLDIVLPVGNSFDRRSHGSGTVSKVTPTAHIDLDHALPQVKWSVPTDCEEPTFVELWMPSDAKTGVRLKPPLSTEPGSPVVGPGKCVVWPDADNPSVGIFHLANPACGTQGSMVLIALAPTTTFSADIAIAPAGYWRLELACSIDGMPKVDAYIARNDPDIGQRTRGRTARFVSSGYDPNSYLRPADDDFSQPDVVSRRGTMNWTFPVTAEDARGMHVVAGRVLNTQFPNGVRKQYHPPYSSAGPDRLAKVNAPEGSCVTDESIVSRGVRAGGTRSGGHARIIGTSTAAPQLARMIANRIPPQQAGPHKAPLSPNDLPLEGATAYDCPDE